MPASVLSPIFFSAPWQSYVWQQQIIYDALFRHGDLAMMF
jgi:hypothetical protein